MGTCTSSPFPLPSWPLPLLHPLVLQPHTTQPPSTMTSPLSHTPSSMVLLTTTPEPSSTSRSLLTPRLWPELIQLLFQTVAPRLLPTLLTHKVMVDMLLTSNTKDKPPPPCTSQLLTILLL